MINTARGPRGYERAWAAAAALGGLAVLVHLWRPLGAVGATTYLGVVGAAAGLAVALVVTRPLPERGAWALVAAGMVSSGIGDAVAYGYAARGRDVPDVSWGDPLWLGAYAFLIVGVSRLFHGRGRPWRSFDLDTLIDTAAVALVTGFATWQFFVSPTLSDPTVTLSARLVAASYPVLDAVLLTFLVRAVVGHRRPPFATKVLGAGLVCWLAADLGSLASLHGGSAAGPGLDVGWMAGSMLLAAALGAAVARPVELPAAASGLGRTDVGLHQVAWTVLPLLVPAVVNAVAHVQRTDANAWALLGVTGLLAVLVLVRTLRLEEARNRAQVAVGAQERFFRTLSANSSDAVIVVDAERRVLHDSPALHELLRLGAATVAGRDAAAVIGPADPGPLRDLVARAVATPGEVHLAEVALDAPRDEVRVLDARAVSLLGDPDVRGVVVTLHDATERKDAAEELTHQAFHDPLTGLANRALFRDRLDQALRRAVRSGLDPAVIFLDVDGFKKVNDSLGHEAGDALLVALTERVTHTVRPEDTVARLGGDEFAVLIEEAPDPLATAVATAEHILAALGLPLVLGGETVVLSASLGIEVGHPPADPSSVLRNADVAMYRAKSSASDGWVAFDPSMRAQAQQRLHLETDLAFALERGELRVVYQPVVELATGLITGFEALLRWDHPIDGPIAPDVFVPVAEDTGLIVPIGAWVLREACAAVMSWPVERHVDRPLRVGVNVSGVQIAHPDLADHVARALASSGMPAELLVLEITETALIGDPEAGAAHLAELRRMGIRFAIDDFGTGYSSLSYLRQFPVDILKIDRSFVAGISEQDGLPAILRGVLDLGRTLGLDIVAEGIEQADQLARLQEGRCRFGQGYLFARPLPSPAVAELLARTDTLGPADAPVDA